MLEGKTKKILIGVILVSVIILIFVLVKVFILKPSPPTPPPPEILSPEEVTMRFFSLEQEKNRQEAEKYLFSDFSKAEIFSENYRNLRTSLWIQPEKKEGPLPEYKIINQEIKEGGAKISIETITNVMEGSQFFNFRLPKKIILKIDLEKEGDYWKITKIDSPDLILERKLGEKVEIKENVYIKPVKIDNYQPKGIKTFEVNNKFLFLEVEFENRSTELISFSLFNEWRVVNENKEFYYPIPKPPEIMLPDIKLNLNEIKKGYVFFEVSEDFLVKEVTFQNSDKKVIFEID